MPVTYGSPLQTAIAMSVLAVLTLTIMSVAGIRQRLDFVGAAFRAVVQLLVVALVIAWILAHPQGTLAYLAVMVDRGDGNLGQAHRLRLAQEFAGRRPAGSGCRDRARPRYSACGALPLKAQSVVPFTAQIIGGAMTAVSLTGSYSLAGAAKEWGQVEAYLALGFTRWQSVKEITRDAAQRSLIPGLDQTRSAGLDPG